MLDPSRRREAAEIASLILANALLFHEELARTEKSVIALNKLLDEEYLTLVLSDQWRHILSIDYVPIFRIAYDVLASLPTLHDTSRALRTLINAVLKVSAERAALRHDLMGRIYHTLLRHKKYLGTYYTSVASASLLLKLALDTRRWNIAWNDASALKNFRVADLACGTGTLLMAVQQAITDNYVRFSAEAGEKIAPSDLRQLHRSLMEDVLYGYDVLTSAVHLTASTLAILAPEVVFNRMNLFSLPLGVQKDEVYLGSVDFAVQGDLMAQIDLMGESRGAARVTGKGGLATAAPLPKLDLCVMNPPFTRSVGGNLLFGSVPPNQRKIMQRKLAGLLKRGEGTPWGLQASSTAGLGSVFVAVADKYLKNGGRMALVLPQAVASGVAWEQTRKLLAERYILECMVVSHDPRRWNFSDSTNLSEILLIAKRKESDNSENDAQTTCVNLWKNPDSVMDAMTMASIVARTEPADLLEGHGVAPLLMNKETRAEVVRVPWKVIKDGQWYPCLFAQTELVRTAHFLRNGALYIAPQGIVADLPLTYLSSLGQLGPDRRGIHDWFYVTESPSSYPALWGHDSENVISLKVQSNKFLQPKVASGKRTGALWKGAGRVMLVEGMRLNTQRIVAARLDKESLSNVWWPFHFNDGNGILENVLVLWMNSTFGLLTLLSHRVPTEGPWVHFKKSVYGIMPVLDVWRLELRQIKNLSQRYSELSEETLLPLPRMADDPVRKEIDDCICAALALPRIDRLRETLAREPVISLLPLYRT